VLNQAIQEHFSSWMVAGWCCKKGQACGPMHSFQLGGEEHTVAGFAAAHIAEKGSH
jgi:hypothetical protein